MVIIANPAGDKFFKENSMVVQREGPSAGPSARWIMIRCDHETMGETLLGRLRMRGIVPDRLTVIRLEEGAARRILGFSVSRLVNQDGLADQDGKLAGGGRSLRPGTVIGGGLGLLAGLWEGLPTCSPGERLALLLLLTLMGIIAGACGERLFWAWEKRSSTRSSPPRPPDSVFAARKSGGRVIIALRLAESDQSRIGELEQIIRETGARRLK